MTEIERIIDDVCKRIDPNYGGEIYIRDKNHTPPNNWTRLSKSTIAKAIEQYVIKARIETANRLLSEIQGLVDLDIAQLKKGVE